MSQLNREQIDLIASEVVSLLKTRNKEGDNAFKSVAQDSKTYPPNQGIFSDIDSAVMAAKIAHQKLMEATLEKRSEIISSIRKKMLLHAEDLAKRAHGETGLGRIEDKIIKNKLILYFIYSIL